AENIREVFWMATDFGGPHHSVLYVSPAYEDVWGRTRDSLYRDPRSFIDGICPEDRVRVIEVNERNHGQRFEVEYRVMRPNGSIRRIGCCRPTPRPGRCVASMMTCCSA